MTRLLERNAAWLLIALAGSFLSLAWMLASPVGASPDEPAHITYAWGTATGQTVLGEKLVPTTESFPYAWSAVTSQTRKKVVKGKPAYTVETREQLDIRSRKYSATSVQQPQKLLQYPAPTCYRFHADRPVKACLKIPPDNDVLVAKTSYMTRYPPLFYAIEGAQLRTATAIGFSGPAVLYGARLTSVVVTLLTVGFGVFLLARRFPGYVVALVSLLALPPMAWFLAGSVNPSGVEIAAAFLLAAAVLALRVDHARGGFSVAAILAVPLGTLLLAWTRPLSWVWASLILCLLLVPTGHGKGEPWTRRLPVRRLGIAAFAATALILASAMVWFGYAYPLRSSESGAVSVPPAWAGLNPIERIVLLILRTGGIASEMIGNFGWLDTPLPDLAIFVWLAVASVAIGIWFGGRSPYLPRWSVGAVLGLGYLAALLDEYAGAWGWQGRYLLPVTAAVCVFGVPGLANGFKRSPALQRLVPALLVALLSVHVLSVVWFFFRNVYGVAPWLRRRLPSTPLPQDTPAWTPPFGQGFVLSLVLLALVCGLAAIWRLRPVPDITPDHPTPDRRTRDHATRDHTTSDRSTPEHTAPGRAVQTS